MKHIARHPLNRGSKAEAILRFLKWQLGVRLISGPVVVNWIDGSRVIVYRGETGFTQNLYCGLHDLPEMSYILHLTNETDIFVDIGANVGAYTILACGARRARGYCFEPVPATYGRLTDNLLINHLGSRVTAFNLGVSDQEGALRFIADRNCSNHVASREDDAVETIDVPVRSLDSILDRSAPTILKIDVEGFETRVLQGAPRILANPSLHSVIMELNGSGRRYGFNEDWILREMESHGFSACHYDPFTRRLEAVPGKNDTGANTLFVRGMVPIQARLLAAPKFHVNGWSI